MLGQCRYFSGVLLRGIGNARWGGARLAPLLEEAGLLDDAKEVVFWGVDRGTVTIRDNVGIISGGWTGTVEPDDTGGLDLTITEQFARSMSLEEALHRDNLLCYEMNGAPLPHKTFPRTADRSGLVRRRERQMADADRSYGPSLRWALHGAGIRQRSRGGARRPHYGDDPMQEYLHFYCLGVDGVFSDNPDTAVTSRTLFWNVRQAACAPWK